ncbi:MULTISPECIES: YjbF family lipoprotein [unclassified Yoonia]|uniref:YjbF family lipoprotein n=1 Tax=unclassified Yoonia TaxID=2629118 RepID=UPI002AFFBF6C|nr:MULTISPECIES: YjbF family lipoprotein [unclassified Yoonia]
MTRYPFRPHLLLTFCGLSLALTACGNRDTKPVDQVVRALFSQLTAEPPADMDAVRSQLTPEMVAALPEAYTLFNVPKLNAGATMTVFAVTGNRVDWRGDDGVSIVMLNDIVIATRGLGADLFLADAAEVRAAVADRSGTVTRRHSWLDGENREVTVQYDCMISVAGVETVDLISRSVAAERISETCYAAPADMLAFTNDYWIGVNDGLLWQSNQWISENIGYVLVQHLKR